MLPKGKGVYIWQPRRIGSPQRVADAALKAGVSFVAIKGHDERYIYNGLQDYVKALRDAGIRIGVWGYVYLGHRARDEAKAAISICRDLGAEFYLIDAETHAKRKYSGASAFAEELGKLGIPIGLNSYWKPSYHPELPWKQLRSVCSFDCPQVYWRGSDPVGKLSTSKLEYAAMKPRLPMSLVAGDMYLERGVKPTPTQLIEFLSAANDDPEIGGVVMWSMDQMGVVPELWDTFSSFDWKDNREAEDVTPKLISILEQAADKVKASPGFYQSVIDGNKSIDVNGPADAAIDASIRAAFGQRGDKPLFSAVVTARGGLNVRTSPGVSINNRPIDLLPYGKQVDVWGIVRSGFMDWAQISKSGGMYVAMKYLKRV